MKTIEFHEMNCKISLKIINKFYLVNVDASHGNLIYREWLIQKIYMIL